MSESAILTTIVATPNQLMKGCSKSEPNTQTSQLNLTSKTRGPNQATYQVWGTNRSDALSWVVTTIFHQSIFRTGIDASTLPGLPSTPPQRQTAPPPCARPSRHICLRDPVAPCRQNSSSSRGRWHAAPPANLRTTATASCHPDPTARTVLSRTPKPPQTAPS